MIDKQILSRSRRLPVVHAAEAAECGLACITMISCYHGHDVDLNALRQRYAFSLAGGTLRSLVQIADDLAFSTRALRVDVEALASISLPAILHWDLNHFVVLKRVRGDYVEIHDPAVGARRIPSEEFANRFSGVALELTPSLRFDPVHWRVPVNLSSLWSRLCGLGPALLQVLGLSFFLQITAFVTPFYIQLAVDQGVMNSDADLLGVLALSFGVLVLIQGAIEALRGLSIQAFGQLLAFQLVGNIVRHLLRLPAEFFEKRHVGDILSRLGSVREVKDSLTRGIATAIIDGMMAAFAGVLLFIYSPLLAWVVIATLALSMALSWGTLPAMKERQREQIQKSAREQTFMMETVRAATLIKLMGGEARRESAWRDLYASVANASFSLSKHQQFLSSAQTALTGIQTVIIIYLGARAILEGAGFSLGMMFAFLSFRQTFSDRVTGLINQGMQFRLLSLHLDRLADIVATPAEGGESPRSDWEFAVEGRMALREVTFKYGVADAPILRDITIEIEPGEFIALVGPSGGGKTTLMKLMLGLRLPSSGTILLDGKVAEEAYWRTWRKSVGVVSQDDRLLTGTIADNIAFFDPDLDMHRVRAAAIAARVHDDIARSPMGYLTLVGDMGSTLSGGQQQRILLARALYREPKILFLDEGTANLDGDTEEQIADLVATLPMTRVVVAHRPALIRRADRVMRIRDAGLECVTHHWHASEKAAKAS